MCALRIDDRWEWSLCFSEEIISGDDEIGLDYVINVKLSVLEQRIDFHGEVPGQIPLYCPISWALININSDLERMASCTAIRDRFEEVDEKPILPSSHSWASSLPFLSFLGFPPLLSRQNYDDLHIKIGLCFLLSYKRWHKGLHGCRERSLDCGFWLPIDGLSRIWLIFLRKRSFSALFFRVSFENCSSNSGVDSKSMWPTQGSSNGPRTLPWSWRSWLNRHPPVWCFCEPLPQIPSGRSRLHPA